MFVDACAIIAVLSDEPEAGRVSDAIASGKNAFTSPVAEFLDERGIEVRDLPPAAETTRLALSAAHRYRSGRHGLNLGDCLHYACAKYFAVPILATADEFRQTDLATVP